MPRQKAETCSFAFFLCFTKHLKTLRPCSINVSCFCSALSRSAIFQNLVLPPRPTIGHAETLENHIRVPISPKPCPRSPARIAAIPPALPDGSLPRSDREPGREKFTSPKSLESLEWLEWELARILRRSPSKCPKRR
jgi:hypothetical protein